MKRGENFWVVEWLAVSQGLGSMGLVTVYTVFFNICILSSTVKFSSFRNRCYFIFTWLNVGSPLSTVKLAVPRAACQALLLQGKRLRLPGQYGSNLRVSRLCLVSNTSSRTTFMHVLLMRAPWTYHLTHALSNRGTTIACWLTDCFCVWISVVVFQTSDRHFTSFNRDLDITV